jgi:hypothetical protein
LKVSSLLEPEANIGIVQAMLLPVGIPPSVIADIAS